MTSSHHKPNWLGKPAAQMRADQAAWADQQPVTTTCLFCAWTYTGLVADGRDAARTHRELEHPEACIRRARGRRGRISKRKTRTAGEEAQIRIEAQEARRLRSERELADMLAKVERGRLRGAA